MRVAVADHAPEVALGGKHLRHRPATLADAAAQRARENDRHGEDRHERETRRRSRATLLPKPGRTTSASNRRSTRARAQTRPSGRRARGEPWRPPGDTRLPPPARAPRRRARPPAASRAGEEPAAGSRPLPHESNGRTRRRAKPGRASRPAPRRIDEATGEQRMPRQTARPAGPGSRQPRPHDGETASAANTRTATPAARRASPWRNA